MTMIEKLFTREEAVIIRDALTDVVVKLKKARKKGYPANCLEKTTALRDCMARSIIQTPL